jgi:hypothetical protein
MFAFFMRLWSLHPSLLDIKGLVALWRESLLAKKVLEGNTKGYKNHPQLKRFYYAKDPLAAINFYLEHIHKESLRRNYNFDAGKFTSIGCDHLIPVTKGQVQFELKHLEKKVKARSPGHKIKHRPLLIHPLFELIDGPVESWEIV